MKENHKQGADGLLTDGVRTYPVSPLDFDTYDEASFRLSQFPVPVLFDRTNPHARLFVANFDGTGNDAIKDPNHKTGVAQMHEQLALQRKKFGGRLESRYIEGPGTQDGLIARTVDGITGSRIRAGYINAPTIDEVNPPSSAGYLNASNIITRRMYERLSTQVWEWKQSDPDAHAVLVTPMEGAGTLQAVDFLDIVRNFQVVDRASIRDTDESTEGAEVD